jgi:hypothetical protein
VQTAYARHTTVHAEAPSQQALEASIRNRTSSPTHTSPSGIASGPPQTPPASFVSISEQLGTTELMKLRLKWCGTFQTPSLWTRTRKDTRGNPYPPIGWLSAFMPMGLRCKLDN